MSSWEQLDGETVLALRDSFVQHHLLAAEAENVEEMVVGDRIVMYKLD